MVRIITEDCSEYWESAIDSACESIVIFTPYFDYLLVSYIDDCSLDYSEITLVTQIDRIDGRRENAVRLAHLINLQNRGVNIRILDRLHAKVLIVDWEVAYFGSQNFTNYSRDSFEISTEIHNEGDFAETFSEFENWLELAYEPDLDEILEAADGQVTIDDD